MIAIPWSPIEPNQDLSPGRTRGCEAFPAGRPRPDRSSDVHEVGVAALDHLGIAGNHLRLRRRAQRHDGRDLGRRARRSTPPRARVRASAQADGPRHRKVVDCAVDRQLADRAARETQRLHHKRSVVTPVGPSTLTVPASASASSAGEANAGTNSPSIERRRGLAAGSVGHRDVRVAELRPLGARRLDDREDLRLAVGDQASAITRPLARGRSARSCSRPRTRPPGRPCTSRSAARGYRRCRTPCTPTA